MSLNAVTKLNILWMADTQKKTHTGKLESAEHLLLYNQIELAITESKKEEKKPKNIWSCKLRRL